MSGDFLQTNTCGSSIAAGASCTVNVSFRPTASGHPHRHADRHQQRHQQPDHGRAVRHRRGGQPVNLAAGRPTSESSHTQVYASGNVTDANQATYWESANNAFPQWVQVDLGSAQSASRVVLQLPCGWGTRNQTLSIQGSTNGTTFSTAERRARYTFNPTSTTR